MGRATLGSRRYSNTLLFKWISIYNWKKYGLLFRCILRLL